METRRRLPPLNALRAFEAAARHLNFSRAADELSVTPGAGTVLVNANMISETPRGAVVGLDHARPVTADLAADGAQRLAQVVIANNAVRG